MIPASLSALASTLRALSCLCLVLACLGGCATSRAAREIAGVENRIRKVHIEGNDVLDDATIRAHLYLRPTTWFPLPKRRYFFEGYLPVDMERIEQLYATYGYHEARVVDAQVHPVADRSVVDLVFFVEEGLPTDLVDVRFAWPEGAPSDGVNADAVQTRSGLKIGKPFNVDVMHQSESTMKATMLARGYAFAEVDGRAEVNRASRQANVRFTLRAGPRVRIGRIRIEGLRQVPEKPLRTEIDDFEGKYYSPTRISAIEQALYAMGVFSSVVAEVAEAPDGDRVDVTLRVTEGNPQQIKVGLGIGFDPARWEQHVSAIYSHENLFKSLTHFDVRIKAGYAELPRLIDIENYRPVFGVQEHGPIFSINPRLRKKGLLEKKLVWEWSPAFDLGIQQGYQYYSPTNRIGVSRFFTRFVETSLSHNVQFFDYFNVDPSFDRQRSLLGLDYRDPYLLSYIELGLWFHLTNQVLNPSQGVVIGATYDLAGGIFGGDYDYNKIVPEIRGYWTPIHDRLQFAVRAQAGFILPYGKDPGAPFVNKFYLGGASTVRGWGLRRLSPYLPCVGEPSDCNLIPIGGNTMVLGNVESRVRVWKGLWMVAFFDVGDVQAGVAQIRPSQWNYAMGPGVRYKSPVGTFRLDVGFRLNETEGFESQPRWALHFGLGDTF